jgi:hypothetical protein
VKEAIMADINDLVQDFWRTSSDYNGPDGESFLAMCRLLEILRECFHILEVCFDLISVFATADKDLQRANPKSPNGSAHLDETELSAKFEILFAGYRKMFDFRMSMRSGRTIR